MFWQVSKKRNQQVCIYFQPGNGDNCPWLCKATPFPSLSHFNFSMIIFQSPNSCIKYLWQCFPSGNYQSLENISNYKLKALKACQPGHWSHQNELHNATAVNFFRESEDLQSCYIIKLKAFNCTHLSTHFSSLDVFWSIQTQQREQWLLWTCHLYILKLPSSDLRPAIQYAISTPKPAALNVILELLNVQIFRNSKKKKNANPEVEIEQIKKQDMRKTLEQKEVFTTQ